MTGDKPLDEVALALTKIARAYQDHFDRSPFIAEILYALEMVIGADPTHYLADPEGLDSATFTVSRG